MDNQEYYKTDQAIISDFSPENITAKYNEGFVLTRLGKGEMIQTRSLRINLEKFELNSENRRILSKNEDLRLTYFQLPLENYSWGIHKLGKDFYTIKFGDGTMSAAKIKELFNDMTKSNMNTVFEFGLPAKSLQIAETLGYALAYENAEIVHYAYPFYKLDFPREKNLGMAMMLNAVQWSKANEKKYIYLGSVTDSKAKYKLQFEGLEWFDIESKTWNEDLEKLKNLIL